MPVNALNAALIGAVLENTPKNSNPAATVAEILNIGREAAYRRMRGEVPFTFGEAALVAARLSFSLDRIMGTDDPDCVLFRLDFSDGQTLLEDYPGKVESWIGKMEEIASDEQSEFSLAGSSLPAALYLGYERLVRFRFFKCFFQHGMLDGANNRFDDMQLPPHVFDLSRRLRQAVRQIDTTYYVLDHSCFKHWVNAIRSFRAMRLISEGCVRELREELLRMLDELEEIALTGRFPTAGVPLHIGRRSGGDVQLFRLAGGAEQRDGGLFGQFAADLRSGHVRTYQTVGTGHAAPFDARLTERGVAAAPLLQGAARRGVGAGCGIGKGGPVSPPPKSVL